MKDMYYEMTIAGCKRRLPLCPISDELNIGAFVIFGDPELTTAAAQALVDRAPAHDVMITAESKGIPLICEMARLGGEKRYILARKAPKLYMRNVFVSEVRSITTDHVQTLCLDGEDASFMRGKRVLVVGLKCDPMWRTPAGLALVGPRYFGIDTDYIPLEERAKGGGENV